MLLIKLINNVNTKDDLKDNGSFFTSLKSTLYPSLLSFDNIGLSKLQDIYIMKLRKNVDIETENVNLQCYNIRCNKEYCSCKRYKSLKSIYCYIIRAYNHANPEKIITYGLKNTRIFSVTIHYIIMNLKHFTTYDMFINYATKSINNCLEKNKDTQVDGVDIANKNETDIIAVNNDNNEISYKDNSDNSDNNILGNNTDVHSDESDESDDNIILAHQKILRNHEMKSMS